MSQNWSIFSPHPAFAKSLVTNTVPWSQARYTLFGNVCATSLNQIKRKGGAENYRVLQKKGVSLVLQISA